MDCKQSNKEAGESSQAEITVATRDLRLNPNQTSLQSPNTQYGGSATGCIL